MHARITMAAMRVSVRHSVYLGLLALVPLSAARGSPAEPTFRTAVSVPRAPFALRTEDTVLCVGSCFAEHMGARLAGLGLRASVNEAHGILYNPLSIGTALERIASAQPYERSELIGPLPHSGQYVSFEHHSALGGAGVDATLARMNARLASSHAALREARALFLTLGTAWAYRTQPGAPVAAGRVVANCHRQPPEQFAKVLLEPGEAAAALAAGVRAVRAVRPELHVVLTVSPVRHWKDGAHGNALSKASCLLAAHALQQSRAEPSSEDGRAGRGAGAHAATVDSSHALPGVCYFPAYELVLDELRDYRFYAPDMLHPSEVAIDFVWAAFSRACVSADARALGRELEAVRRAAKHRPFASTTDSEAAVAFAQTQLDAIKRLERRCGDRIAHTLREERRHFERQLAEAAGCDAAHTGGDGLHDASAQAAAEGG